MAGETEVANSLEPLVGCSRSGFATVIASGCRCSSTSTLGRRGSNYNSRGASQSLGLPFLVVVVAPPSPLAGDPPSGLGARLGAVSGTTTWSDGSTYEGELLNGQPHGKGKLLWPDKSYYDGCWSLGEYHGEGSFYCALDGSALKGTFRRNSFLSRDGKWIDASKLREEQHLRSLRISPANSASATVPIIRCTPEEVGAKILAVQREAPFFVPLVLADASCGEAAPLALLELGDRGCTEATTVHLAHAANEKRRQRDHLQIFRSAMNEAVQTDRPFVLAFGDGAGSGNPQEERRVVAFVYGSGAPEAQVLQGGAVPEGFVILAIGLLRLRWGMKYGIDRVFNVPQGRTQRGAHRAYSFIHALAL